MNNEISSIKIEELKTQKLVGYQAINFQAIFARAKSLMWFYLVFALLLKVFGLRTFNIEVNDETQYRNYKCNFKKKLKKMGYLL